MSARMRTNNHKVIFFDLFGVLLGLDYSKIINYIYSVTGINAKEINYDILFGEYCMKLERGEIDFDAYFNYVQYKLSLGKKIEKQKFYSLWTTLNVGTLPIAHNLEEFSRATKLCIITNTTTSHIRKLKKKYSFFEYINQTITSDTSGFHKPNPLIYQYACKNVNVKYENTIFVDDSLININSAKKLGIIAHHYKNYKKFKIFYNQLLHNTK